MWKSILGRGSSKPWGPAVGGRPLGLQYRDPLLGVVWGGEYEGVRTSKEFTGKCGTVETSHEFTEISRNQMIRTF